MIGLISAHVSHARIRPKLNQFRYTAPYVLLPIKSFSTARRGLFSIDRTNLFNLRSRDYGDGKNPQRWISYILDQWQIPDADSDILLMTLPRVLGFAFNPVNFWFCRDRKGQLRAVLAEVNNTFGERHCYLCFHDDKRAILPQDTLTAQKLFHVSPFIKLSGMYCFRFSLTSDRVSVSIALIENGQTLLRTSVGGLVREMTKGRLLWSLVANPLLPFKILGLIHYQAVKLFLKRIKHVAKPPAPAEFISH